MLDSNATLQREAIYQHFPGYLGAGEDTWRTTPVSTMQQGDWKLLEFLEDGRLELYNLKRDLGETHNLAQENPDQTKRMQKGLHEWREKVRGPTPTRNDMFSQVDERLSNTGEFRGCTLGFASSEFVSSFAICGVVCGTKNVNQKLPRMMARMDATRTAICERLTRSGSSKASVEIKMDMVKPMPASMLAPTR